MEMMEILVVFAVLLNLSGSVIYARKTLRGEIQPNRVSFFMWALAPMIGVAAALVQGTTWAVLPVFGAGFGPFMIFIASFFNPKAYWKIEKFDWVCGALSIAALILWQITKTPNIAIFFAILSDGMASLPTLKKSWTHPQSESIWPYFLGIFSSLMGILVAKSFIFSEVAFPIYIFLIDIALTGMILTGHWRAKIKSESLK